MVSVAPRARDRTLIVKSLALAGWRIGYLSGPKAVISAVNALPSDTTSNSNVIAQRALPHYLHCGHSALQQQLQRQVASARALGLSILSTLRSVPQTPAQGGFYFYLDLSELQRRAKIRGREFNADDVVNALLMNARVATVSGTAFGDPAGIRLSYGIDLELLDQGLRRLTGALNTWSQALGFTT